jgi:hypothetical protein
MKKILQGFALSLWVLLFLISGTVVTHAEDTVVVGRPYYYGAYGGYGGYMPYGGYAPYSPNPALQGPMGGVSPFFLGNQMFINRGATTRHEIRNAFRKSGTLLFTPNPVDFGYYPDYYSGYLY